MHWSSCVETISSYVGSDCLNSSKIPLGEHVRGKQSEFTLQSQTVWVDVPCAFSKSLSEMVSPTIIRMVASTTEWWTEVNIFDLSVEMECIQTFKKNGMYPDL